MSGHFGPGPEVSGHLGAELKLGAGHQSLGA